MVTVTDHALNWCVFDNGARSVTVTKLVGWDLSGLDGDSGGGQ